ncbi:MAG: SDR family oxidoreductase [Nocardioidaceae bacterium]|nr:SDR family oxidoreductase [Nocardioidaceae bacterium]
MTTPGTTPRTTPANTARLCLVTGATGYVGGRLVPDLLAAGHRVRVMVRDKRRVEGHSWADDVEVAVADATDADAVREAVDGIDVAYYLLHSIGSGKDFAETEEAIAQTFAAAAVDAGVERLVYLGGLAPPGERLSTHMASRVRVGEVLLASGVPTAVLRAAVVIGSGSASFEMVRYLTERLPVMITPRWVDSRLQPIAIRDVLRYLVGCATLPADVNRAFDIGGPEVLTYKEMMARYATVKGLPRRRMVRVPVLTPRLSSHWVGLVTPVPSSLAKPLVESVKHTAVVQERDIAAYVPDPPEGLIGFDRSVELALAKVQNMKVPTSWSSAQTAGAPSEPLPSDPDWAGGDLFVDARSREVDAPPAALWRVIEEIGGDNGWYSFGLAWHVRGWIDRLSGGPGLRRGRRNPRDLVVGDPLDFWRVEEADPGRLLRLRAEMRVPGLAWLELEVGTDDGGTTTFRQRALFHPRGILGHAYWWSVYPFHGIVFGAMQRNIARAAERLAADPDADLTP